jgi:CMP/dCMP kinase
MQMTPARPDGMIIAIDGPAASGKSSTARAVAAEMGYRYLDSGAFYRALTLAMLRGEVPRQRWSELTARELDALGIRAEPRDAGYALHVGDEEVTGAIRSTEVTATVSAVAALPAVREWLLASLRSAGQRGGLVADGRDIGTVVFPDAEVKIFLVCAPEERALRRLREQGIDHPAADQIRAEAERLSARDSLDIGRETAPLMRAPDAVQLDTTALPFDVQVRTIVRLAQSPARA